MIGVQCQSKRVSCLAIVRFSPLTPLSAGRKHGRSSDHPLSPVHWPAECSLCLAPHYGEEAPVFLSIVFSKHLSANRIMPSGMFRLHSRWITAKMVSYQMFKYAELDQIVCLKLFELYIYSIYIHIYIHVCSSPLLPDCGSSNM